MKPKKIKKQPQFYVKLHFGNFRVMQKTELPAKKDVMIVGYSRKIDATNTADGLNRIRIAENIVKRIKSLNTTTGYGYYCK